MAVCVRAVGRGRVSRAFSAADALLALRDLHAAPTVFVEVDAEGFVTGGAAGAVRARLAPHVHACNAVVARVPPHAAPPHAAPPHTAPPHTAPPHATVALQVRVVRDVPPLHELLLWFDEELLAAVDMPFLTFRNIRGRREYSCHECGARFDEPNPLKAHLFERCAPHAPLRFWRLLIARLAPPPAPPPPPAPRDTAARLEVVAAADTRAAVGARLEAADTRAAVGARLEAADTRAAVGARLEAADTRAAVGARLEAADTRAAVGARLEAAAAEARDAALARLEALAAAWGRRAGGAGHACVYCGKLYSRKYGLKIHVRTHTGYRPLRCPHCARAFGDPSNLNKHVRLHAAPHARPTRAPHNNYSLKSVQS